MSDQVEDQRHVNPSGLDDDDPKKVEQPVEESHHEEGHVDPESEQPAQEAQP
jgi:hypothetical protein